MAAVPVFEEQTGGAAAAMMAGLAGLELNEPALAQFEGMANLKGLVQSSRSRRLSVYPASAGFEMAEELEYLSWRAIEPNIFFNPRFLAPAMPRLEDREIRFITVRDENDDMSRLRFLMPFSVERSGLGLGPQVLRAWSSPFAPLGTPLLDRDDPVGVLEDVLDILGRKHLKLPDVLVIPDIAEGGPVANALHTAAIGRNLSITAINQRLRPMLAYGEDPDEYFKTAMSSSHLRGFRSKLKKLHSEGAITFNEARDPVDVRRRTEEFLALEAFAREALYKLAERDMCRVHTLDLNGKAIASLIVLREAGTAYTWKTAYNEDYAKYSPGTLLMMETTKLLLDDPNIMRTDSLSVPDHPVMSRLWKERQSLVTLVIGLAPGSDRTVRQAASQIQLHKKTQNVARTMRERLRALTGRS
jgi:Acetyltransferase (GNAT) domain